MAITRLTGSTPLRCAAISIAAYDYLITIPAEWRMYRSPRPMRFGKISFVLIRYPTNLCRSRARLTPVCYDRYISIILLTISNVGYFYHGFSATTCSTYYMVSPILKLIQITISQVIIGYRTWAITRQSKGFGLFLLGLGLIVTALESFATLNGRTLVQTEGNCSRTLASAWVFYPIAAFFDAATCIISTLFLVRWAGGINCIWNMSALAKLLFYDGLGYMVALTAVNVLNATTQLAGSSFEYTVIWIMSQRILIHIHGAVEDRAHPKVFPMRQISTPHDTTSVMRIQPNRDGTKTGGSELDVKQPVTDDYSPFVLEMTTESRGSSRTRDRVSPRGPRDHPENSSRV